VWWPETMHVRLAPDRMEYRIKSPLSGEARSTGAVDCQPGEPAQPWYNAVAALAAMIDENMRRRLRLDVVVSDRLVRYLVLPHRPEIATRAEWRAYALHRLESVYGEVARGWRLRIDLVPPGRPSLACAVDNDLVDALRQIAGSNTSRLVAVRPNFIHVFNQRRAAMRGARFWLAAVEGNTVVIGLMVDGSWRAMRNECAADGWRSALPGVIRRVQLALPEPITATLYLHNADGDEARLPETVEGLPLRVLHTTPRRHEQLDGFAVAGD